MFKLLSSLAVTNLKKNHSLYLPFGLATGIVTMISYIVHALSSIPELSTLRGGSSIALSLGLGVIVIQVVALLIVLYANSFVMKNRSKEFGLYGILGLDRKNVQILSFMELFLFAMVSVTAGIALGMVFHRFAFAVLLKLIKYPIGLEYHLQIGSIFFVYIFMGVIFLIVFFLNATKIYTSRPLELLKTKKFGETKGRFMKTRAVIGFVILGLAYYMSQTIESPMAAIMMFFVAVVMVVIATYILFDAGSIAILSALQKNKKLFYQPTNFISISNLKFRMRKNAAGLASVCILSTMVLVTLGTTVSLQVGAFKTLNESYPTEYSISSFLTSKEEEAEASKAMKDIQAKSLSTVKNEISFVQSVRFGLQKGDSVEIMNSFSGAENVVALTVMSQEDYNRIFGTNLSLKENEMVVGHTKGDGKEFSTLTTAKKNYKVVGDLNDDKYKTTLPQLSALVDNIYMVVVKDVYDFINPGNHERVQYYSLWNTDTKEESLKEEFDSYQNIDVDQYSVPIAMSSKTEAAKEIYGFMGSLLFIGALLSVSFFVGAVLVIYYKQISEGYEDRARFVILQKMGIDHKTVKQSINRQVLIVFFMPLLTAFMHTAFAFKMYTKIALLFGVNTQITLIASIVIGIIFLIVYFIVYKVTSRSYFNIVKR